MKINQIFNKKPSQELLTKVLNSFGLDDLDDCRSFTRTDIRKLETIDKIMELKTELSEYYIPCKARNYLNDLNEKNVITVLRQVCKVYDYKVISTEKHINKVKYVYYKLMPFDKLEFKPIFEKKNEKGVISFD